MMSRLRLKRQSGPALQAGILQGEVKDLAAAEVESVLLAAQLYAGQEALPGM